MLQFEEFCRLCAQKKRNKVNLFTSTNNENANILLAKISICLSLQVSREDLLPKMVCFECQKSVENFNLFRIKCHKAEERFLKMLSISTPNKTTTTNIKQENAENDFHDSQNYQVELNSNACQEQAPLHNTKLVKCEIIEENEHHCDSNFETSDLIQILSNEVVNQQALEDVKQPQIEVISENFNDKFKTIDVFEIHNSEVCEVKVIPEIFLRQDIDEQNSGNTVSDENELLPINFVEIKEPVHENDDRTIECALPDVPIEKAMTPFMSPVVPEPVVKKCRQRKKKLDEDTIQCDIDEKYFTLADDETCSIDMEEVEAVIRKKQDPNTRFQCDKCNKSFKFFKTLKKHKHWHDMQPQIFICHLCKENNLSTSEFSSLKTLNNHIQRKHTSLNKAKFECQICHKTVPSKGELNAHLKKVHSNAEASCPVCCKKFKNKVRLNYHLIVHREDRPFVCDQCGQSFKWSSALKVHMQWHRQEKNFLCSECGKKFTAKKNLIEHLNIHAGKRPFTCEHCNATFVQLSAYTKHLYLHNEGKKIHKCDQCQKSYSHAFVLKQHLLRHTGLRPYECVTCHCTFKSQSDLWCHSKTHQEKRYGCAICGRKFALSKTLKDHMVVHTGIKHFCPAPGCGKTYTQRFSLTKHFAKQHPSFSIVSRKGGRKAPGCDKSGSEKDSANSDFIRYDFKDKDIVL